MTACHEDNIDVIPTNQDCEYIANMPSAGSQTRTTLAGAEVFWDKEDRVAVFEKSNQKHIFKVKDGCEGKTSTILVRESDQDLSSETESFSNINSSEKVEVEYNYEGNINFDQVFAYYPSKYIQKVEQDSNGIIKIRAMLPYTQVYREDSFGDSNSPMVAVANNDKELNFKNICGLLKLNLIGIRGSIEKIDVQSPEGKNLSGYADISFSKNSTPSSSFCQSSSTRVSLHIPGGISAQKEVVPFYIALLPDVFSEGLELCILTSKGIYKYDLKNEIIIKRSGITEVNIDLSEYETTQTIVEQLKCFPKTKCVHHDNFYRADQPSTIGSNSSKNDVLHYEVLQYGSDHFNIGIKNHMLVNEAQTGTKTTKIVSVDPNCSNYTVSIERSNKTSLDARLAFRVLDMKNYYWARLTQSQLLVYRVKSGQEALVKSYSGLRDTKVLSVYIKDNVAKFSVDNNDLFDTYVENETATKCGPCFYSATPSAVNNFFVEVDDAFVDTGFDDYLEQGLLNQSVLGTFESPNQIYNLSLVESPVRESLKAIRFELRYSDYSNYGKYRVEICPKRRNTKALDSWIFSYDVMIPSNYVSDYTSEQNQNVDFICQLHDAGPSINPPFAIIVKGSELHCIVRGHESPNPTNKDVYACSFKIADVTYDKWMNFVIYLREGYTEAHHPKTMVWVNGVKKVDSENLNSYNATNYIKFGQYKPIWGSKPTNVDKRIIYFDNIHYIN